MKFVDASYTESGVVVNGFYLVEGNYATYIGKSGPNSKNWWFWQFYVDDEDMDRLPEIMTNEDLENKYEARGYSEAPFSSVTECLIAIMRL